MLIYLCNVVLFGRTVINVLLKHKALLMYLFVKLLLPPVEKIPRVDNESWKIKSS